MPTAIRSSRTDAGGTVDPNSGSFRQFEVVTIKATPKAGYRIKRWVGTADDTKKDPTVTFTTTGPIDIKIEFEQIPSVPRPRTRPSTVGSTDTARSSQSSPRRDPIATARWSTSWPIPDGTYIVDRWRGRTTMPPGLSRNTVTMTADTEVTVRFKQARTLDVPAQYKTIAAAIKAARTHGDKIIVNAGTYRTHSLDFDGKAITVASEHPDDPAAWRGRSSIAQNSGGPSSSRRAKDRTRSSTASRSRMATAVRRSAASPTSYRAATGRRRRRRIRRRDRLLQRQQSDSVEPDHPGLRGPRPQRRGRRAPAARRSRPRQPRRTRRKRRTQLDPPADRGSECTA